MRGSKLLWEQMKIPRLDLNQLVRLPVAIPQSKDYLLGGQPQYQVVDLRLTSKIVPSLTRRRTFKIQTRGATWVHDAYWRVVGPTGKGKSKEGALEHLSVASPRGDMDRFFGFVAWLLQHARRSVDTNNSRRADSLREPQPYPGGLGACLQGGRSSLWIDSHAYVSAHILSN